MAWNYIKNMNGLSFGKAFDILRELEAREHNKYGMRLTHWRNDVIVKIQTPDDNSKMTAPYLYVDSRYGRVPWKETMIELFADNWCVVSIVDSDKDSNVNKEMTASEYDSYKDVCSDNCTKKCLNECAKNNTVVENENYLKPGNVRKMVIFASNNVNPRVKKRIVNINSIDELVHKMLSEDDE